MALSGGRGFKVFKVKHTFSFRTSHSPQTRGTELFKTHFIVPNLVKIPELSIHVINSFQ